LIEVGRVWVESWDTADRPNRRQPHHPPPGWAFAGLLFAVRGQLLRGVWWGPRTWRACCVRWI